MSGERELGDLVERLLAEVKAEAYQRGYDDGCDDPDSVWTSTLNANASEARKAARTDWADYIEHWDAAVGPEPPTVSAIIAALRAEHEPFGRTDGTP
jgi:hypothetical protein